MPRHRGNFGSLLLAFAVGHGAVPRDGTSLAMPATPIPAASQGRGLRAPLGIFSGSLSSRLALSLAHDLLPLTFAAVVLLLRSLACCGGRRLVQLAYLPRRCGLRSAAGYAPGAAR